MRFAWLFVVTSLVATGCIRSQTSDCGQGTVCASGQVCVRATDAVIKCSSPEHSADCGDRGRPDGELCEDASGRCYDGYCLPISCGDQLIDPTERCDDGNTVAADGCSADCRSDEQCGTGVVDPLLGEACDDGNLFAHDGCTPGCTLETPRWEEVFPATPLIGPDAAIAYLPSRGRAMVFGGSGDSASTSFEWTGTGWLRATSAFAPQSRPSLAMAYDSTRDAVVMHGGHGTTAFADRADTWEWRRNGWSIVATAGPARSVHAMAYDTLRKKLVMFGGEETNGLGQFTHGDTWEWDGVAWTQRHADGMPGDPPARRGHAMAFDARIGKVIMFGGRNAQGYLGDTWAWDGTSWALLATTGPKPREGMAFAADRMGLLLYGGSNPGGQTDTWRWTGTWTQLVTNTAATSSFSVATTDLARGVVVLAGSADGSTWEWDSTAWTRVKPLSPPGLIGAQAAYDALRGDAIIVHDNETVAVRSGCWVPVAAAPGPARTTAGLVYDVLRDRTVLFGGADVAGPLGDTWVLARNSGGGTWSQVIGAGPTRRSEIAMAYDAVHATTVLFGGIGALQLPNDETWLFDTAWHQVTPATAPPARYGAAMGYDTVRGRVVMFGGFTAASTLSDTWEWDGTSWTRSMATSGPPPRGEGTLTWNASRRRLTLTGGSDPTLGSYNDVWEWSGTAWTEIDLQLRPMPRSGHLAMQTAEGIEVFGGVAKRATLSDTWLLSWVDTTARYDSCTGHLDRDGDGKTGCADPECWAACAPLCGPGTSCAPTAPTCGDGVVAPQETCGSCAADLGVCTMCGDLVCESPETAATCPGDCP